MSKQKSLFLNIPTIFTCVVIVFASAFLVKANSGVAVQFTADTIISLSGIDDGDLYIRTNSECAEISAIGSVLTVTDIPVANNFILKTTSHDNGLKLTPSGGVLGLTLDSGNISSGNISQWTLDAETGTTVAHIIGVPQANEWYAVKVNGAIFNTYQSSASSEISFTYNGGFSSKVFTIEEGSAPGGGLPPVAYNLPSLPEPTEENPEGGFSILINNGDEATDSQMVTLKLFGSSNTERMAISNSADFKYASQVTYQEEMEWELSDCNALSKNPPSPLLQSGNSQDGNICIVYAKFYTQYGVASEVVFDSIILNISQEEAASTETSTEEETPSSEEIVTEAQEQSEPESTVEETSVGEESNSVAEETVQPTSFVFTKTLAFNSNNNQVIQLQDKLKQLGHFPENIESNGNFGPATEQAVIEFQKSAGIYPCGVVGPRTRKALNGESFITNKDYQFTEDLKYNDKDEEVSQLQTRLRDQNFFPYNIQSTSWFGPITQKAVNLFQGFYNLAQSGIVDEKMREILNR